MRFLFQCNCGIKGHRRTDAVCRVERCTALCHLEFMLTGCIIESWLATHFEMYVPSDDRDASDDLVRLFSVLSYWHEVRQLSHSFFRKKSREQNIRLR